MAPGKGPLRIAIEDFLTGFGFGKRVSDWLKGWLEGLELEAIDAYDKLVTDYGLKDTLPPIAQPDHLRSLVTHQIQLIVALMPLMWSIVSRFVDIFIGPFMRPIGYLAEALARTRHPDAPQLLQMIRRNPELEDKLRSHLTTTGYDQLSMDGFDSLIDSYLGSQDYIRLFLRGDITDEQLTDKLTRIGFKLESIDQIKKLSQIIPTPAELIQMAVREAWNENVVSRFNYDAGFNDIPEFKEWMTKQGYSEDWAKRFWRAHWQLPGINQAYEALHRLREGDTKTTVDDIASLLKVADIPEFWRSRLIAISYAPYTRIDIRRMWKLHILNEDDVFKAHLDIGYDEEHARKLTQFVVADQTSDKSDITRAALVQAFKRGVMTRDEAKSGMVEIGLSDDDAEFYLSIADYDLQAEQTDAKLTIIQQKYVSGVIDETGLAAELGGLNLPSERMTALQQIWTVQRTNKINIPSRSELDDLLRRSIITHDDYASLLKRDGYEDTTIGYFTTRIDQIIAADAAAELAAQQTEQQRLSTATLRTSYQVTKADIAVTIAQLKSAIADITLALHSITDPAQVQALKDQIAQYKNDIVHQQEQAANLYSDFTKAQSAPGA